MTQQIKYEEALTKIAALEKQSLEFKTLFAAKKGMDEDEDKKLDASFKQAMEDMDKKDKEHSAMEDDKEKVKDAFKKAEDESDPEKKKEAMKKAMEMKEDHDEKAKKGKKAEETPKENVNKQKEQEAKIAAIVMKKIPLMNKILEATKIMDAPNYDKVVKQLEASTLEEVEKQYDTIKPYLAVIGAQTPSTSAQMGMLPFQASAATGDINQDNVLEGSVDTIDFAKVKTSDIMGMYN